MASTDSIRLKLFFELPPPGMPMSSKYAILVKLEPCTTVSDIERMIIRKFGFSRGASLTLALGGFVALPSENARVFKNDDLITVLQCDDCISPRPKKRKLPTENVVAQKVTKKLRPDEAEVRLPRKGKKKNKTNNGVKPAHPVKKQSCQISTPGTSSSDALNVEEETEEKPKKQHRQWDKKTHTSSSSSSDTDSSEANRTSVKVALVPVNETGSHKDTAKLRHQTTTRKSRQQTAVPTTQNKSTENNVTAQSNKKNNKPPCVMQHKPKPVKQKKMKNPSMQHTTFDSSSDSDSSVTDAGPVSAQAVETPATRNTEGETKLRISGLEGWLGSNKHTQHVRNGGMLPTPILTNATDPGVATNLSVVIHNPSTTDSTIERNKPSKPDRCYTDLRAMGWPPQVGDSIAFKQLEMTENYTPEISDYKEASVLQVLSATESSTGVNSVVVDISWPPIKKKKTGRFEMDLGDEDEDMTASPQTVEWVSLLEPKLIARGGV